MLSYFMVLFCLFALLISEWKYWYNLFFILSMMSFTFMVNLYFEYENFHVMSNYMGLDKLSGLMCLLSMYIVMLMLGSNLNIYSSKSKEYYMFILLLMLFSLLFMFSSLNVMLFYILFELILIPTYLLILVWGYEPERLYAGNYLLFYTLFASLPLLLFILYLNMKMSSLLFIYNFVSTIEGGLMFSFMGLGAFLIKIPMFIFHLWLPKAHVEAPISASMILAGVLLKMGGYGLIRMLSYLYCEMEVFGSMVVSISLVGSVLMSLICLRQVDLKSLIAYSSVVHMGLMLGGIFSGSYVGMCGSIFIMVGHGLCSAGLFYLASVVYTRLMSRSIIINKGLLLVIPSVSLLMFLLVSSNMASPLSLNFLGEVELIISLISWNSSTMLLLFFISFFSGAYCIYLFSTISHGNYSRFMVFIGEIKVEEYLIVFSHWVPLNLFFMKSELFLFFMCMMYYVYSYKIKLGYISSIILLLVGISSFYMSLVLLYYNYYSFFEWNLFYLNSVCFSILLYFDWMAMVFIGVVMLISSLVMYYSMVYMAEDKNIIRFVWLILLFVMSMGLMIISPSVFSIMIGWDGLGLISYCLVIYYNSKMSASAGMMTILMNRIGDIGLLLSIGWLFSYGAWNILSATNLSMSYMTYVISFILLASLTKSAQVPFSSWLPAAMAAPTPVSALVHSSTLVTAGVYLLIRFSWLLEGFDWVNNGLMIISLITLFFAGGAAMLENDLKKIIALSTLSQLGLMMFILSLGWSDIAFFHLLTHALFKSLLFLCGGKLIHVMNGIQDVRYMGGVSYFSPFMGMSFMLANISLCGFPFMSGFYSKDLILEGSYIFINNYVLLFVLYLSIMFTCIYSFRVLMWTMMDNLLINKSLNYVDEGVNYFLPFLLLSIGSICGGSILGWLFCSESFNFMLGMFYMPFMLIIFALIICWKLGHSLEMKFGFMMLTFLSMMLFMSKYLFIFNWKSFEIGYNSYKMLDNGWIEESSVGGVIYALKSMIGMIYYLQFNEVKNIFIYMLGLFILCKMMMV